MNSRRRLENALADSLQGTTSPAACLSLIRNNRCSVSVEEACAAHELLMLAVDDGAVPRSPVFEGRDSFWMQELYSALPISNEHANVVRAGFRLISLDATDNGVVESSSFNLNLDVIDGPEVVCPEEVAIWRRLLEAEPTRASLTEQLTRFRGNCVASRKVGIAVSIIAIARGAHHRPMPVGSDSDGNYAEVTEDVVTFATDLTRENSMRTMRAQVLFVGRRIIAEQGLALLSLPKRELFLGAVSDAGLSIDIVRSWFERDAAETDADSSQPQVVLANMAVDLGSFRGALVNAAVFMQQTDVELSRSWAAYIVAYRSDRMERFRTLQNGLLQFLRRTQLCARDLVELRSTSRRDEYNNNVYEQAEEVERAVVRSLYDICGLNVPLGVKIRCTKYIRKAMSLH